MENSEYTRFLAFGEPSESVAQRQARLPLRELWRQDLNLLWQRWDGLPADEQEWLIADFVRRAEAEPARLDGLAELAAADLDRLESLNWLDGPDDATPAAETEEDLPSLESLNLPELALRGRRDGLKQLYSLCQTRLEAYWLKGVTR